MRPLRILLIVHHDLDPDSGAAGSTLALAREFEAQGHTVTIYSFSELPASYSLKIRLMLFPGYVARYLAASTRRDNRPDVVDATTGDAWIWARLRRKRQGSGPALITRSTGLEHLADLQYREDVRRGETQQSWKYNLYHGGFRLREVASSLRNSDACTFLNHVDRDYAVQTLKVAPARAHVLPNGIPQKFLNQPLAPEPNGPVRIAHLGSYILRKGVHYAVPALDRLLQDEPELRVTLLGTGAPEEVVLADFSSAVRTRVQVVPRYRHDDLPQLLRGHSILLNASIYEGFGKGLLEGMACGLAAVTTPAGFAEDRIRDGEHALLVPPRDVDAIYQATRRLVTDPALRGRLGQGGWSIAQDFSWERAAAARLDLYQHACDQRQAAA